MEPYLALKRATGSDQPVFFSISTNKAIDMDDERRACELTNNNCWATPQGWILVRDGSSSTTYLMDPHNRNQIPLPHLPEDNLSTYCTCLLSEYPDPPKPTSCIVLLVETDAPVIWYCHVNDKEWVRHEYDIGTLPLPDLGEGCSEKLVISPITACQGKFYFNGSFEELGVLEFCPGPVFRFIKFRDTITKPKGFRKVFMVESEQELYMVCLMPVQDVMVHKMDFCKQEWHQVNDIGDRAFLLSSWYFGASRSAKECGLERNSVYMVYPWNKSLTIFNMRDGTSKVQNLEQAPASEQALWMTSTHP